MNSPLRKLLRFLARPGLAAAAILLSPGALSAQAADPAFPADDGAEVLTRGPVHEGFAGTITFDPAPGMLVPRAPPALIEELPPDQRPVGNNISWIPGYWAWDDEDAGFIWVSGIWRNLPPGRQWMPGYWTESGAQYQWISGYWADAAVEEVEYLDDPPESQEAGPNIASPSVDHSWMPGSWTWRDSRYLWRPGYWDLVRPDWIWVPAQYIRTPRGCIFVDGYYDYNVARRGMIFAPVRFSGHYYTRPDHHYRPSTVIGLAVLADHLFLRPSQRHYYFGDYYDTSYRRTGFFAACNYASSRSGYDPIYAHDRWSHRDDSRWVRRQEESYRFYQEYQEERPPHTLTAFLKFESRAGDTHRVKPGYATPLAQLSGRRENAALLQSVDEKERANLVRNGREIRSYSEQRRERDRKTPDAARPRKDNEPRLAERIKIARSPAAAKANQPPAETPPARPRVVNPEDKPSRPGDRPQPAPGNPPRGKPDRNPAANPNADPTPGREPKVEPKREPKVEPKREPKVEPKREPGVEPKREPRVEPKREPKVEPKREPGVEPKREPKVEPNREPRVEPKVEPKAEPKREPKVEPKHEPRVEPKREPKAEPKREPKVEPKAEPKREPKAEPKREPKVEPKAEPKREPKFEPKPKPEPRVEPKREPKAEPKREPRVEPKREPTVEPKREPKVEPKREPRVEPKREPRVEPKREPRVEPKREPKAEPKREPKVEPKREPKAEPKPEPKSEPEAEPGKDPADKEKAKPGKR